ncbi:hypothetical protein D3C72_2001700 [compost metagenome]
MGGIVAQALRRSPPARAGCERGCEDRNIRFSLQRSAKPGAQQGAVLQKVQKARMVLDHRRWQERFVPVFRNGMDGSGHGVSNVIRGHRGLLLV